MNARPLAAILLLATLLASGCASPGGTPGPSGSTPFPVRDPPGTADREAGLEPEGVATSDWPMVGGGPRHLNARPDGPPLEGEGWSVDLDAKAQRLALAGDVLLVAGEDEDGTHALNASTGQWLWSAPWSMVAVSRGVVLARTAASTISAIELGTRDQLWSFTLPLNDSVPGYAYQPRVEGVAVSDDGRVVLGTSGPSVYCLELKTGDKIWQFVKEHKHPDDAMGGNPTISGPHVITSGRETLVDLDLDTGVMRWKYHVNFSNYEAPSIQGDTVIVSRHPNLYTVVSLDLATGAERWKTDRTFPNYAPHAPILAGDVTFVHAGDNSVYAFDVANGDALWDSHTGDPRDVGCGDNGLCIPHNPAPALLAGILYVHGMDGVLYAFNATNGKVKGTFPLATKESYHELARQGTYPWSAPIVAGDAIYVGSGSRVVALPVTQVLGL